MDFNNVIFVGPQKTGTSLIYDYLINIPVSVTYPKETFYFELSNNVKFSSYISNFNTLSSNLVEISPSYFSSKKALFNIKSILPNAHIIISIRNPQSLIISYLYHLYSLGRISANELKAKDLPKRITLDEISYNNNLFEWINQFDKVSLVSFEKFTKSHSYRLNLFKSIFSNLDLADLDEKELPSSNAAFSYNPLISRFRQYTPYLNILPFSKKIINLKEKLAKNLKKNKNLPFINKEMNAINSYVEIQKNFFSRNKNFENFHNSFL